MLNPELAKTQLEICQRSFASASRKLLNQDKDRLHCLEQFIQTHHFDRDVVLYHDFILLNDESLQTAHELIISYEQILAYVLLLQEEGHRSREFQDLFTRYQLVEKKFKTIVSLRKKEGSILGKLGRKHGVFGRIFSLNLSRNLLEKIFRVYIKKEVRIAQEIIALFASSHKTLQKLQVILQRELRKEKAQLIVSTSLFMVPVVGTVLFVVSSLTLTWANEFTANYRQLLILLKEVDDQS
mgnify:CR=1 FL=1